MRVFVFRKSPAEHAGARDERTTYIGPFPALAINLFNRIDDQNTNRCARLFCPLTQHMMQVFWKVNGRPDRHDFIMSYKT